MHARFIIIDPSLMDYGGHYYHLDVCMGLAARSSGLRPIVFANRRLLPTIDARGLEIVRWFPRPFWEFVSEDPADPESFSTLTRAALVSIRASPADHIFVPTVGGRDLEDILVAMRRLGAARLAWHIMLHYAPDDPTMHAMVQREVPSLMEELVAGGAGRVWFYAVTPEIARLYHEVTRAPVAPTYMPARAAGEPGAADDPMRRPLHVVMLGSARPSKGYAAIPALIARLYDPYVLGDRLRFTIHAVPRRADPIADLEALRAYGDPRVRLIRDVLTSSAYLDLLASADIVLLPYAEHYRTSGSGVLTEALLAGKPIIVHEAMSQARDVAPDQKYCISDPEELANAVLRVAADYPRYSDAARRTAPLWRRRHSPEALLDLMLEAVEAGLR